MASPTNVERTINELEERLSSVSGTIRFISFLHGLGEVFIVGFAFFLFSFLADFLIADLPGPVRQIILGVSVLVLLYTAWKSLVQPVLHPLTPRDIAVELEEAYPELNDRLISTIDLMESNDRNSRFSKRMVEELLEDMESVMDRIRPHSIVSVKPMLKRFGTGLLCVGLVSVFFVTFPEEANTWLVRLSGENVKWPQATRISLENPERTKVVEGNDLSVRASIDPESKRVPPRAYIQVRRENGPSKRIEMTRTSASGKTPSFVHEFRNVQENFQYVIRAGDGRTREGSVHVLPRPRIDELTILYDYPEYTGKKNTPEDEPVTGRQLTAPFDTIATVRARVPSGVRNARAFFESGEEVKDLPVSISSENPDTKTLRTELEMRKDGELFFELFLEPSDKPSSLAPCAASFSICSSRFGVKTKVDQPPRVKLLYPGKNKFATPRGRIPIRSESTDDYGIASITFTRRVNDQDPESVQLDSSHNDQPYNRETIRSEYLLDLNNLPLESGDTLYYSMSASDTGTRNEEPSSTKTYRLSIMSPSRLEVKLQKLQEEIRDRLSKLREDQNSLHSRLNYHLEQLSSESQDASPGELRREIEKRRNKQRSLTQRMKRIANELERIKRDARYNRLWDKKSRNTISSIHEDAVRIENKFMSNASTRIAKAVTVTKVGRRSNLIEQAITSQNRAIKGIDALLNDMGAWYNYADIIHEWKKVLENLKQLRENEDSSSPG